MVYGIPYSPRLAGVNQLLHSSQVYCVSTEGNGLEPLWGNLDLSLAFAGIKAMHQRDAFRDRPETFSSFASTFCSRLFCDTACLFGYVVWLVLHHTDHLISNVEVVTGAPHHQER